MNHPSPGTEWESGWRLGTWTVVDLDHDGGGE